MIPSNWAWDSVPCAEPTSPCSRQFADEGVSIGGVYIPTAASYSGLAAGYLYFSF